ncbi:hypothetical protein LCI18_004666 [Fusarium solani-melongenae]|uniref:Uncharacterized protein n=1 Tax=Fusarium solani subsp. cucurbitae TaxID=2747967 RepID=A0ACD3YXR7_FUSSC|nr:hypothetical protein LCI18_004666 [Fusarium solani-melongenae]
MRDVDEDAPEMVHTPNEDGSEDPYTPEYDVTVDKHTPDEEVLEDVDAPDEVVPPAPTTPDRPIEQHPLPPLVDATSLDNESVANRWGPVAGTRMAEAEQLMDDEFRDSLYRRPGPYMRQPRDVTAGRNRDSLTAEFINFALNHGNAPNTRSNRARLRATSRYRCQTCHRWTGRTIAARTERIIWAANASCYYCTYTVSWSLATDETSDLRQTLANAEDHIRSGQEEFQRERQDGPEIYFAFVEGPEV